MKVIIYSDIHGGEVFFSTEKPDLVFVLGDIDWRDVKMIDDYYSCPKIGVLGNHDKRDTFIGTSIIHAHMKLFEIAGLRIAGFDGCPIYNHKGNSPQYSELEMNMFTQTIHKADIFLAHSNPAYQYINDLRDPHRGFRSLTDLMDERRINMLFHGHIHENNVYTYKETTVVSTHGFRMIEINSAEGLL